MVNCTIFFRYPENINNYLEVAFLIEYKVKADNGSLFECVLLY